VLQALVTLHLEKDPQYALKKRLFWLQSQSGISGKKKKISYRCRNPNTRWFKYDRD
jgi:hypothetical protein